MSHYGGGGGGGYGGDRKRPRDDEGYGGGGNQRYGRDGGGRGYRGGGGGGGGGRWRDNDERRFDKKAHHPPQPRGPGGHKPRSKEEEIQAQIKALLVKVADFNLINSSMGSLDENVEGLASALNGELSTWGTFICDYIVLCAAQLPMQTSGYATLVGLLNATHDDFGKKVVRATGYKLQICIHTGRWINAKLLLRFLAELVNARTVKAQGEASLGALLTELMAPVQDDSVPKARRDLYVYLVASTLPWVWEALCKEWPDGFPQLVQDILGYGASRTRMFRKGGLRCLLEAKLDEEDEGEPVQDSVEVAIHVVQQLSASLSDENAAGAVDIAAIAKPWASVKDELSQGQRHDIPVITLPDPDPTPDDSLTADSFPLPFHPALADFELFDPKHSGERPATLSTLPALDRHVLRDYLKDMLVTFRPFVTEAGVKRGSFRSESEQLLSVAYFAPQDVATEYMVVEALLLWLLQLPGRDSAYLHRLLIEFVGYGDKPAGALMTGLVLLVQNYGDLLDHVALIQLGDWFGSHLTNTQMKLPDSVWGVFANMVPAQGEGGEEDEQSPQVFFLRRAFDIAVRLTYQQRLKDVMPDPRLHALLPGRPFPKCRYMPEGASEAAHPDDDPLTAAFKGLVAHFRTIMLDETGSSVAQAAREYITAVHPGVDEEGDPLWRVAVLANALAMFVDNSICYFSSIIERCIVWLRELLYADEAQERLLDELHSIYGHSPQMLLLMLESLMSNSAILPLNAAAWVLRPDNARRAGASALYWDLLQACVDHSFQHVNTFAHQARRAVCEALRREEADVIWTDHDTLRGAATDAIEVGVTAAENALDLGLDIIEKSVQVLTGAVEEEGDDVLDAHWFRALLSYFRNTLLKYVDMQRSPFNTLTPCAEPLFAFAKAREAVQGQVEKHKFLKTIFEDAQAFLDDRQQLGGTSATGQELAQDFERSTLGLQD